MAQDIDFLGAVYPDVPAVRMPKQGGGYAAFDDTTDADATAADIAAGKTAYVNGVRLVGTGSGGTDISLGITGAAAGQIAEIASVDSNGAPTAWGVSPLSVVNGKLCITYEVR